MSLGTGSQSAGPRQQTPEESRICLLDESGSYSPASGYEIDELSVEQLQALYRFMAVSRRLDEQAIRLQRQGQLAVYPSLRGQEAAQVGSAYALNAEDWVFPSYREVAAGIVRGLDPAALLHVWRGTWHSGHDPHEHRFGLMTVPIATQTVHATGYAMGAKFDDKPLVVMTYLGDGATSAGDAHVALNFAAVFEAPCVFVIQNNQYAISVGLDRQTRTSSLAHKAVGYGMPGISVDGNDVLAMYAVTRAAVDRARRGEGPTLIEAYTYRMEPHTTADDATRYRSASEVEGWSRRDPIARYEKYLRRLGIADDQFFGAVDEEAEVLARSLRQAIFDAPATDPLEMFQHVFVDVPEHLDRQRELLASELARWR